MRASATVAMEVTPHLKTVLKSYQHSATKSLQGPGLADLQLVDKEDDFSAVCGGGGGGCGSPDFHVPQLPILSIADTTCSEITETVLEGEGIACFDIGGEMRLCLPQVLNSVLRDFDLLQINMECDSLNIYCSRCTPEQLNVLKNQGILPSAAYSCGLIRKTDAQRLCSALLRNAMVPLPAAPKGAFSFRVYHECFGKCVGICYPGLFFDKDARCVECLECHGAYSPQQFVCHVHRQLEIRTLHWGFDAAAWRNYTYVCSDQIDHQQYAEFLDEMRDRYLGKVPYPAAELIVDRHASVNGLKRKQMHPSAPDLKTDDVSLKKHILEDYAHLPTVFSMPLHTQIDPHILQCLQGLNSPNRTLSAFKPVPKDGKIRHNSPKYADPPLLQYPDRIVHINSESFKANYQPNVALAPPKKYRYLKQIVGSVDNLDGNSICGNEVSSTKENGPAYNGNSKEISVIKHEKDYDRSPENLIDSTVSVVQSTGCLNRYSSEIELSTDTDDSGSELNEKADCYKVGELMKDVDSSVRARVIAIFNKMSKELDDVARDGREKDNRITELTNKLSNLENEITELKNCIKERSLKMGETQNDLENTRQDSSNQTDEPSVLQEEETASDHPEMQTENIIKETAVAMTSLTDAIEENPTAQDGDDVTCDKMQEDVNVTEDPTVEETGGDPEQSTHQKGDPVNNSIIVSSNNSMSSNVAEDIQKTAPE